MLRLIVSLGPVAPADGLAIDEAVLEAVGATAPDTIRFWVNDRAVIVGRSQSVSAEVDLAEATAHRIPVLRRISGGGAVFHHPGNLNLSLALRDGRPLGGVEDAFDRLGGVICEGLGALGIPARVDGNRLLMQGKKIGGAAQARRRTALLYHTTLLLQSDTLAMHRLLRALRPGYAPLRVASRPHPTASLAELGMPVEPRQVVRQVGDALGRLLGQTPRPGRLTGIERARALALATEKYREELWNRSR